MAIAAAVIPAVVDLAKSVLGRWIPDAGARDAAAAELASQLQQADLISLQGQIDIDKIEAASSSMFVAGGRPALMWTCVFGIAVAVVMGFIVMPVTELIQTGHMPSPPDTLMGWVVATAGGLAGLKTTERWRGVATDQHQASREAAVAAKAAGHPPVTVVRQ